MNIYKYKKAHKGSCQYKGQKRLYCTEVGSQLKNELFYKKVSLKQDMLCDLQSVTKHCGTTPFFL